MGETFSTPTINPSDSQNANPSDSNSPATNMSSGSPEPAESDPQSLDPKTTEGKSGSSSVNPESKLDPPNSEPGEEGEGEKDEEEGECGFCLYMKGGGCKDAFIAWEECINGAKEENENYVDKCAGVTVALTKCMRAHSDYYEPILRAEKAAEQEVMKELEEEKEAATSPSDSEDNAGSKDLKPESGSQ